jgi:hypothetical protein
MSELVLFFFSLLASAECAGSTEVRDERVDAKRMGFFVATDYPSCLQRAVGVFSAYYEIGPI